MHAGITRTLWLRLLADGGYSTVTELVPSFHMTRQRLAVRLDTLAHHGFLKKVRSDARKNGIGYGVTQDCKVPQGVNLKDILVATRNVPQE